MPSTEDEGLCLSIEQVASGNRRRPGISRHLPRTKLEAVIAAGADVRWVGSVVDLSFGGACVAVPSQAEVPERVTIRFQGGAAHASTPGADPLDARITGVERPSAADGMLVHLAFQQVGIAALRIAELLGPAKAAGDQRP